MDGGTAPYTLTKLSGTLPESITSSMAPSPALPQRAVLSAGSWFRSRDAFGATKTHTYSLTVLGENPLHLGFGRTPGGKLCDLHRSPGVQRILLGSAAMIPETPVLTTLIPGALCRSQDIWFGASGQYQVCLTVYDSNMTATTDSQWVTVVDILASVNQVWIEPEPSFQGIPVNASISYADQDSGPFTCKIDWGDGSPEQTVAGYYNYCYPPEHTYAVAGSYPILASVSEAGGDFSVPFTVTHEVVYVQAITEERQRLASNTHPTTIELMGAAMAGTDQLEFSLELYGKRPGLGSSAPRLTPDVSHTS